MPKEPKPLTERQTEVLQAICEYDDNHGRPPTLKEIGRLIDVSSTGTVRDHLTAIERKGWITRESGTSRGTRILQRPEEANGSH